MFDEEAENELFDINGSPLEPLVKIVNITKSKRFFSPPEGVTPSTAVLKSPDFGYPEEYDIAEENLKEEVKGWESRIAEYKNGKLIVHYISPDRQKRIEVTYFGGFSISDAVISRYGERGEEELTPVEVKTEEDVNRLKEEYGCEVWDGRMLFENEEGVDGFYDLLHEGFKREDRSFDLDITYKRRKPAAPTEGYF